ncbi:alpha/beta fold hydrolase [Microbacterium sp. ZXX196]|uniref:alpha/beta fold hydrolase n=1 Tax=Microbacterium sp. ZXX196 TaxID=2609291 RepID=UPI001E473CFE|nr:alpha/beta hydrolase [Microbacterium sp. ZXX196]
MVTLRDTSRTHPEDPMVTPSSADEFAFLPDQARELGVAAVPASRDAVALGDGRTLSALRYGRGGARVAFLHGAGLNAHTWDRTVLALGEPAVALDLPGHGDSSWRADADYAPSALAPDAARAIEAWASAPAVVVGHSLGGLAAIALAAERPDLVSHLVLLDIAPGAGSDGATGLQAFYERLAFDSVDDVLDHAQAFGLGGDREQARRGVLLNTRTRADGSVEWKHHMARLMSSAAPDERPAATDHGALREQLAAIAAPVTLIAGTRGFLDEGDLAAFRAARPGDAVHLIDAPHNVQDVAPTDIARVVRAILGRA